MAEIEIPNPHEVKEKAEDPFARTVALFVAVYAVMLAIASLGGHNAGKEMMMEQQMASNKWAQYQAKAIREALYQNDEEKLDLDIAKGMTGEANAKAEKMAARIKKKLEEYKKDKEEISKEAKHHEHERDIASARDPFFDFAEVALQIAIVLASVAMLSGKRWAFIASLVLALGGMALAANGYLLIVGVKLPDAH